MVPTHTAASLLTDDLLLRCHEQAEPSLRADAVPHADLEAVRAAGYLRLPVPPEFGGPGLGLAAMGAEQRRLAYYAPALAGTITAHLAWVGVAAELWRSGDASLQWVLEAAARDQLFAAGHSEQGNDAYLMSSSTRAEQVDGGYRFTGYKSLDAVGARWHYLGLHGVELTGADAPRIVHAFLPRNTEGVAVRAAVDEGAAHRGGREDALLDGAFVPERFVARRIAGPAALTDRFVQTLLAWELVLRAQAACGLARRSLDVTVDALHRTTLAMPPRTMASDPWAQQAVARMGMALESIEPHVDAVARQWTRGTRHGGRWPMKLLAARQQAVDGAAAMVGHAVELASGAGAFRHPELERLAADVRGMRGHPASSRFTNRVVARTLLNLSPDHAPP